MSQHLNKIAIVLGIVLIALLFFRFTDNNPEQTPNDINEQTRYEMVLNNALNEKIEPEVQEALQNAFDNNKPMWLMFTSNRCAACVEMYKIYEEIAPEYENEIQIILIDVNNRANISLTRGFQIRYIPATFIFDAEINKSYEQIGVIPIDEMRTELDKVVE